jgi:hypothetical protein
MATYTTHVLSLNETDEKALQALQAEGHKIIDIFRAGMATKSDKK